MCWAASPVEARESHMHPAVLLVAAQGPSRDALHQTLEDAGYAVSEAPDSGSALETLRLNLSRVRPHRLVVLLDQASPNLDCDEILRAIAEDPHLVTHHAYVVIPAAERQMFIPDEEVCRRLTVFVLPQPFATPALLDVVARAASGLGIGSEGDSRRD